MPFRTVLNLINKLYEVDVVIVRNFGEEKLDINPLLFKYRARGYDLSNVEEKDLTKRLAEIKNEIN